MLATITLHSRAALMFLRIKYLLTLLSLGDARRNDKMPGDWGGR